MFIDLNEAGSDPFSGVYDVIIAGSGPAGMTVAREAARLGRRVLLLEAGGAELSPDSQAVYEARSIGPLEYFGVNSCRLRMFGGTSNHWSGRCAILDPIDFEARDIWSLPGWPISHAEAYRRLDDARAILDIADQSLDPRAEPHWRAGRFTTSGFARSAPTRFGEKFGPELKAATRIDTALNANLVDAALSPNGDAITAVTVADYKDRRFTISARQFVLAMGSIENARFLLNLNERTKIPVGDKGGLVGGCFMEHFEITLGRFVAFERPLWERDTPVSLTMSAEVARQRKLGSAVVTLNPSARPRFYGRLAPLRRAANDLSCGAHHAAPSLFSARGAVCKGDGLVSDIIEQTPNADSRVVLDREAKDRFGDFRAAVDWRLSDQDVATIRGLAEETGKALAEQDLARFQIAEEIIDGRPRPGFHCHQMGTTRMASDPTKGVVDENCRVHGVVNLSIAGSGVFPTGGGVNPTLTIVALALRLGEHLAAR
jgi:choline dehydrogenase-like flavoprotein